MTHDLTATILHLQRLSTEDGPGLRTTVFFKGCPLRCTWCHNPESLSPQPQLQWLENRCLGDGACLLACPNGALSSGPAGLVIDRALCRACGACARACPANALELLGSTVSLDALLAEVLKDRTYFATSGGGVTLSGGEPTMQPDFAEALLQGLRGEGVQTALDTCGVCYPAVLERLLPHADVLLFDVKEMDPNRHRQLTGADNELILDNLLRVRDWMAAHPGQHRLWIRTPLIPGATATHENLAAIGKFLTEYLSGLVERWELCAFNNLCRDKYRRLDMPWGFAATPLLTPDEAARLEGWAREAAEGIQHVAVTGATRTDPP